MLTHDTAILSYIISEAGFELRTSG